MSIDLRNLLIDCRIALRGLPGKADDDPLFVRLDRAIREVTEAVMPPPSPSTKTTAQQVALAWQTASRGLKLSHPELYGQLSERVMNLLNTRELVEPVTELLQLEEQVRKLESSQTPLLVKLSDMVKKASEAQNALDQLHKALAAAAPAVAGASEPQALALLRLDTLIAERDAPSAHAPMASIGSMGANAPARKPAPPPEGPIPSRAILDAVVAGERSFSKEQREWMIGECMALTAWEFTPVELLEKGESWMAQKVLESPNPPG